MRLLPYTDLQVSLPTQGRRINAYQEGDTISVYQAFRKSIGIFAVQEQFLGGTDFSLNRMSWIKTSFLWMMYRCGWAEKDGQEVVLRIVISKKFFERILQSTVISAYTPEFHSAQSEWKKEMNEFESRLEWDPDHDPVGKPLLRKTIQLGLKGSLLKEYAANEILRIEDITPFVKEQYEHIKKNNLSNLYVPAESLYIPGTQAVERIKLTT